MLITKALDPLMPRLPLVSRMLPLSLLLWAIPAAQAALSSIGCSLLLPGRGCDCIDNAWIVRVNRNFHRTILDVVRDSSSLTLRHAYDSPGFSGFAFDGELNILEKLVGAFNGILSVECDRMVNLEAPVITKRDFSTQDNAAWGLDRISHRTASTFPTYVYDSRAGSDILVYIIDSGLRATHAEFGGRVLPGYNVIANSTDPADDNGHGTHVAGTAGGRTYGVAKNASLIGVKVINANGSGTTSDIIEGIQWATKDTIARGKANKAVANLSLGGIFSPTLNNAVEDAVEQGLFFAVAAGNSNFPTAFFSPASEASACTIGAMDRTDTRASFSNWGYAVDIYGPGHEIPSAWFTSDTALALLSGTSMASPHAAGLAAYFLSNGVDRTADDLCEYMRDLATPVADREPLGGSISILYNDSGE